MSAKEDFEAAAEHIANARKLALDHLHINEWPRTFNRFDSLLGTFNHLLGKTPEDEPSKDP